MSPLRSFAVLVLLLASATNVWADAAVPPLCIFNWFGRRERPFPPPVPMQTEQEFVILRDPKAERAELRIPRRMMVAEGPAPLSTRHAIVGLAISAAIVAGGLWCLRYRPRQLPKKKLAIAATVVVLLILAMAAPSFVDARAQIPHIPPRVVLDDVEVHIVVVDGGDQVQLVLPPALAEKFNQ